MTTVETILLVAMLLTWRLLGPLIELYSVRTSRKTCPGCNGSGRQQYLTGPEPNSKTGEHYWAWWTCEDCGGIGKIDA